MKIMSKVYFILLLTIFTATKSYAEVNWQIVPERSSISFSVKHLMLFNVKGVVRKYNGNVITNNQNDFSSARVSVKIPVDTLSTGNDDRDAHLQTSDFFYVDNYPFIVFTSTSVTKLKDETYKLQGDISIKETTKPITFIAKLLYKKHVNKKLLYKFKAEANLNRYDFGLRWNELTETGNMLVADTVNINMIIHLESVE